ncbi:MAG: hypothetical protein ACUVRG_03255 [Ignavibacterium sp.]|uniref:hypothetical protein n=1 Tax=Ignavibacterium sp. TaxID=2651167 RepID=UPI00404930DB
MKTIACVYCEGNNTKLAVITKEKGNTKLKVLSTVDVVAPKVGVEASTPFSLDTEGLQLEGIDTGQDVGEMIGQEDSSNIIAMAQAFKDINPAKVEFIPALTEPAIFYHNYEGPKNLKHQKIIETLINEIRDSKNINVEKGSIDFIELSDGGLLAAFVDGQVACASLVNGIANHFGKKFFKIPTIKSADVALAYYVAKQKKFFPDEQSLIFYIGKDYSKLIFLHGRKLKHIGTTLDIGTQNLYTYDVYFSKILLEMETAGISSLNNIVVCGEDDSENLILSFYGTFPEANISRLEFDDFDLSLLNDVVKSKISSFSVPMAIATEFFDELAKEHKGINLLPKYISEERKLFQFSWHSFAVLPLLFIAPFLITLKVLQNNKESAQLDQEINQKNILVRQNYEVLSKITELEGKISSFDQTVAILDSASSGAGVWHEVISDIANFAGKKQNFWLSSISKDEGPSVVLEGYGLDRAALSEFAHNLKTATLRSVLYEPLREQSAFKYNIVFDISSYPKKKYE